MVRAEVEAVPNRLDIGPPFILRKLLLYSTVAR